MIVSDTYIRERKPVFDFNGNYSYIIAIETIKVMICQDGQININRTLVFLFLFVSSVLYKKTLLQLEITEIDSRDFYEQLFSRYL